MKMTLRTACTLDCPDTCTLDVIVEDGRLLSVDAAPDGEGNPLTQGYICQKVKHHANRVYAPERVLTPLVRTGPKGSGTFREASWDEVSELIAGVIRRAIDEHGVDSVFPYLYNSSGGIAAAGGVTSHLFAALGCPDIEETICANTAGVAYDQVFDGMLSADAFDLEHSRLIVVWGANPQVSNTHMLPLLAQAKKNGARLVVIDPRRTGVAARADLHLAIRPGTDVLLAYAAAIEVEARGGIAAAFVAAHVSGAEEFMQAAHRTVNSVRDAVDECGLQMTDFERFVEILLDPRGPAMLRMGWGIERNRNGGSGIVAAYGLWALLGHFGTLGSGVIQSQGRSTKYSTRSVAAAVGPALERRTFSMNQVGAALCGRVEGWDPKVLFIQGGNPAVTSVDQATMLAGLEREDVFTVVHDQVLTDTARYADVVLPATTHYEADDLVGSYGSFTMQPVAKVIDRVGESRTNDEVGIAVAAKLGFGEVVIRREDYVTDGDVGARVTRQPGTTVQFEHTVPANGRIRLFVEDSELPVPRYQRLETAGRLVLLSPATNRTINSMFAEFDPPDAVISLSPIDAEARGVVNDASVVVSGDQGSLTMNARVDSSLRAGVCHIPKGLWLRHFEGGRTANLFAPSFEADLGSGACFNDALVDVTPA